MKTNAKETGKTVGGRILVDMAKAAMGAIGAAVVLEEVNWVAVISAALLAGMISALKSIKACTAQREGKNFIDAGSPKKGKRRPPRATYPRRRDKRGLSRYPALGKG